MPIIWRFSFNWNARANYWLSSSFNKASAFSSFQCEAVFSISYVLSESCATIAWVSINFELSIGPCFLWFIEFLPAVGTVDHNHPQTLFLLGSLKRFCAERKYGKKANESSGLKACPSYRLVLCEESILSVDLCSTDRDLFPRPPRLHCCKGRCG